MGHTVSGIDNFATGSEDYIANQKSINFFEGSITDIDLLKHAIEESNPEIIIHSAASYKDPNDFHEDINTNILGMINLVNHARKMKVKSLLISRQLSATVFLNQPQFLFIVILNHSQVTVFLKRQEKLI